jgi:23S rRNA (uracil1939-C5)-methyltransferase
MQVTIEKLVYGGAGLARTERGVVFVPRTAPGDVVEIEVTQQKKDYATARVLKLIESSPDRQNPSCPNYQTAGCCHWQHIRYERQVDHKESIIRETLKRLAHLEFPEPIRRVTGSDCGYRMRATFHVRSGRLGFVRENSNEVVPIRECSALMPELNNFIPAANAIINSAQFERLEQVEVAAAPHAIAATLRFPAEAQNSGWEQLRDRFFAIPGLAALTFVSGSRRLRYQKQSQFIDAHGYKYELSSDSFFQANRFLLDGFIDEVLLQSGTTPADVLELFCGSGFFSIPLAAANRQLIGVESNPAAVRQARDNAKMNGVWNTEFAIGQVDTTLAAADVHPGLIVLNPPRVGAGPTVAERIATMKAPRIVYVSCNPTTFGREAVILVRSGYRLKRVTMVDQFPNTYHIELVALFELE